MEAHRISAMHSKRTKFVTRFISILLVVVDQQSWNLFSSVSKRQVVHVDKGYKESVRNTARATLGHRLAVSVFPLYVPV